MPDAGTGAATGLAGILLDRLGRAPDRIVMHDVGTDAVSHPVTAGALLADAAAVAGLVTATTGRRGIVAIASRRPRRQAATWLGVLASGRLPSFLAPPSPHMDPAKQAADKAAMMTAAGISWLADDAGLHPVGGGGTLPWPVPAEGAVTLPAPPACGGGDPVLVQHSSGTTGQPKGIALSTDQVMEHATAYAQAIGLAPGHCIASWLPLYHDMGFVACFLLPLLRDIPFVQIDPFQWAQDPLLLWEKVAEHRGSHVWLPNFAFALFARLGPQAAARGISLAGLRMVVNCSEAVSPRSIADFTDAFAPLGLRADAVHASYAMAENVFAVTQTDTGPPRIVAADRWQAEAEGRIVPPLAAARATGFASSGRPLPTTCLRIVDAGGAALPEGRVGAIRIAGRHCIAGYLTAAPGRQAAFRDGWYDTGDRGFLLDGELYVIGREAEFVIVNGRNIPLQEIEAAADSVPGVHRGRSIAIALRDEALGSERPVLVVEPEDPALAGQPASEAAVALGLALRRRIRELLDVAPGDVRLVPPRWIVKSTSGKRARAATLAKYIAAYRPDLQPPEG